VAQPARAPSPAIEAEHILQTFGVNRQPNATACTPGPEPVAGSQEAPPGDVPQLRGSLDKEVIRAVIRSHVAEVKACYEVGLDTPPYPSGRLATRFAIGPSGKVLATCVVTSALNRPEIERCVVDAMRLGPAGDRHRHSRQSTEHRSRRLTRLL
jgi:hypothetical protein